MCPFYTVAGMYELYEQLLPTKLYTSKRIKTCLPDDVMCQLCGKCPESGPHIFAGCSALAHCKYLERHNSALKVLFFELLRDLVFRLGTPQCSQSHSTTARMCRPTGIFPCLQNIIKLGPNEWMQG